MMNNLVQSDLRRILVSEHNHSHRVTDQDDIDPALVQKTGRRIIIGRQRGNSIPSPFSLEKVLHRRESTTVRQNAPLHLARSIVPRARSPVQSDWEEL